MNKTKESSVICNQCNKPKSGISEGLCEHCGKFGKISTKQFKDGDIIVEIPVKNNGRTFTNGNPFKFRSSLLDKEGFIYVTSVGYAHINNFELYVEKKSTREQALEWWNTNKMPHEIVSLSEKYFFERGPHTLTGREIEEIWLKETQNPFVDEIIEGNIHNDGPIIKSNQKQFKEFNAELFEAYINKFSGEDQLKMLYQLANECEKYLNTLENSKQ